MKDLQKGQRILVQVVKTAYANKGPRLTTDIAIPGRFAVLTPFHDIIGVSKKIRNPQHRRKLKDIADPHQARGLGLIVRTVADGSGKRRSRTILTSLASWDQIENTIKEIIRKPWRSTVP